MALRAGVLLILLGIFVSSAFRIGWGERTYTHRGYIATGRIVLRQERSAQYQYDSTDLADRLPRLDETVVERLRRKYADSPEPRLISEQVSEITFPARYSDFVGLCLVFAGAVAVAMYVIRRTVTDP